jgi:hypothetical protein
LYKLIADAVWNELIAAPSYQAEWAGELLDEPATFCHNDAADGVVASELCQDRGFINPPATGDVWRGFIASQTVFPASR